MNISAWGAYRAAAGSNYAPRQVQQTPASCNRFALSDANGCKYASRQKSGASLTNYANEEKKKHARARHKRGETRNKEENVPKRTKSRTGEMGERRSPSPRSEESRPRLNDVVGGGARLPPPPLPSEAFSRRSGHQIQF